MYFGKLDGLGMPYLGTEESILREGRADSRDEQVSNILVKLGKEWPAPDRIDHQCRHNRSGGACESVLARGPTDRGSAKTVKREVASVASSPRLINR